MPIAPPHPAPLRSGAALLFAWRVRRRSPPRPSHAEPVDSLPSQTSIIRRGRAVLGGVSALMFLGTARSGTMPRCTRHSRRRSLRSNGTVILVSRRSTGLSRTVGGRAGEPQSTCATALAPASRREPSAVAGVVSSNGLKMVAAGCSIRSSTTIPTTSAIQRLCVLAFGAYLHGVRLFATHVRRASPGSRVRLLAAATINDNRHRLERRGRRGRHRHHLGQVRLGALAGLHLGAFVGPTGGRLEYAHVVLAHPATFPILHPAVL